MSKVRLGVSEVMYVGVKVKCKLIEDVENLLVANFPENIEAIKYIVKRTQKEDKLTDEEAKKLKEEIETQLTETLEARGENGEETPQITKNVFLKDGKGIYLTPRHIKGWLKECLRIVGGPRGYREAVNHGIIIEPSRIYLYRNGSIITKADGELTRPIQVIGLRGPRSAIKVAEYLKPPVEWEFTINILEPIHKKILKKDVMKQVFEFGGNIGMLGDRSLQMGRFKVVNVEWL